MDSAIERDVTSDEVRELYEKDFDYHTNRRQFHIDKDISLFKILSRRYQIFYRTIEH